MSAAEDEEADYYFKRAAEFMNTYAIGKTNRKISIDIETPNDTQILSYSKKDADTVRRIMDRNEYPLIRNASNRVPESKDPLLKNRFRVLGTSLSAETYNEAVELAKEEVTDFNRIYIMKVIGYAERQAAPVRVKLLDEDL